MRFPCLPNVVANADPSTPAPTTIMSNADPCAGTGSVANEGITAYFGRFLFGSEKIT